MPRGPPEPHMTAPACLDRPLGRRTGFGYFRLGFFGDGRKGRQVVHREIGENLAVDSQSRLVYSIDHGRITEPAQTRGRVDARDPQRAELAFLLAPAAISVLAGFDDRL